MAKEDKEEKDEGLVIVTDDAKNLDVPPLSEQDAEVPEQKAAKEDDEDKGEDADEDERLGASEETEAEKEEKQQARASHKSRRQKRKEAEQKLRNENRFYELRNEKLEKQVQELAKRVDTGERVSLDTKIAGHKALIRKAEGVMAEAGSASKGEELVEATKIRDNLRDQLKEMEDYKARSSEEPEGGKPPPPRPEVVVHAKKWVDGNKWFDFQRRDFDSKIAGAIDDSLAAEGYDPADEDYWQELNKRIAKQLPHRAKKKAKSNGHDTEVDDADDEDEEEERPEPKRRKQPQPRAGAGGPKFRTGGPGRDLQANEVYLSKERIEAMKEAGVWDDPAAREKHLKRYRDWDKENAHLYK